MVKNKFGGSRHKKAASKNEGQVRELIFREGGQSYALVTKVLGNAQFNVKCLMEDGTIENKIAIARQRNKRKRGGWINLDAIILVSMRDFQSTKCDIIHSYDRDEVIKLIKYKELTNDFCNFQEEDEDEAFEFTEFAESYNDPSKKDNLIDNI
uniref:S1-like domain-containing protein n=1 Tax=viral metagenome TaxID=1070528 RepID=A0A6C0JAE4_9ZZZZ